MLYAIGRFGRPHGVRGDIRFWPFNPESELLKKSAAIRIGQTAQDTRSYTVQHVRRDAKGVVVRLKEFDDRDDVRVLTNQQWFEDRADFPELADDEIYYADLIGMTCRDESGVSLGPIKDVVDVGPNSILVIDHGGREVMVPNVDAFVLSMDMDAQEVIIRPLDGLLDV